MVVSMSLRARVSQPMVITDTWVTVITLEGLVTRLHLGPGRVKLAGVSVSVIPAGVGILRLRDHPQQRRVGVGQGAHTPQAATSAATVKRVKRTTALGNTPST